MNTAFEDLDEDITFEEISLAVMDKDAKNGGDMDQRNDGVRGTSRMRQATPNVPALFHTLATPQQPKEGFWSRFTDFTELFKRLQKRIEPQPQNTLKPQIVDMKRFYTVLCSFPTVFDLTYAFIGKTGCALLSEYFSVRSDVRELLLDCNDIGDYGCSTIFGSLNPVDLEILSLEVNQISGHSADILCDVIARAQRLRRISVSNNPSLGDTAMTKIAKSLARHNNIAFVSISNVSMTVQSAGAVASMLTSAPALTSVNLTNNMLMLSGIEPIAAALQLPSSKIRECDLCNVGLNDVAAFKVACAFKDNRNMLRLVVGPNPIGDKGAPHLASVLANNSTIATMDCRQCNLSDTGVQILIDGVLANPKSALRTLHVDMNGITEKGIQALNSLTALRNIRVTCKVGAVSRGTSKDVAPQVGVKGKEPSPPQPKPVIRTLREAQRPPPPIVSTPPLSSQQDEESASGVPSAQRLTFRKDSLTGKEKTKGCCAVS